MRTQIPVPSKGDAMRASWGASVANRVNELCAMAPANMLARDGFGGMGAQPLPANLRDRPAAGASQPMPFDLSASVETSQDGTQKRLVVKWFYGGNPAWPIAATVSWNYWSLTPPTSGDPAPTVDAFGYITAYTGEWQTAENFSDNATIELWFTLQVTPSWSGSPTFSVSGSWEVMESADHDLADLRLDPTGVTQTLVSYVVLGTATASTSRLKVAQAFRGDLHLNDLLCIDGNGGGGGTPDQQGSQSGCWKIATVENQGATSKQLQDCYYNVGGITKQAANQAVPANATGYLCAVFSASGVTVVVYASLDSIQADESKYVVPLYEMNAGEVVLDMRNAPQIQVFEGTL